MHFQKSKHKKWPGKFSNMNVYKPFLGSCQLPQKKITNKMYCCRRKQMRIWELFIPSEWGPIPLRSKPRTLRGPPKKKLSLLSNHNFLNVVLLKFKINCKLISKSFPLSKAYFKDESKDISIQGCLNAGILKPTQGDKTLTIRE